MSRRVLLVSYEPVGKAMTGLGIRYSELARVLTAHADVTLAAPGAASAGLEGMAAVSFLPHAPAALRAHIARADVIVTHPHWSVSARWLARSRARLIYDLYDPETFGTLELFGGRRRALRRLMHHLTLDRLHDALATGHHFMCASEKQRDLWIGALLAGRRIDPILYDRDPSLRSTIDTVPFGVQTEPPSAPVSGIGPRGRFRGVDGESELVLWSGGIWNWLDAETAIRAVGILAKSRPRLRLVFMGAAVREAADAATQRARAAADALGLSGRIVHFNTEWVPYGERAAWLTQADCAISTHHDHLESRFAFRTRALDCFWAGLPLVCTTGDTLAERVERNGLGAVAPPGDPAALAAGLARVLDTGRDAFAPALRNAAAEYAWPRVAQPLIAWVEGHDTPAEPPGAAPGAVRRTPGHLARTAVYELGARLVLARRAG